MENSTQTFFENELFPVIQANAEQWGWPANIELSQVKATYMNALSNMTYKAELEGDYKPILTKKFGAGFLTRLLDRTVDNKLSTLLGELKIGPKVLWFDPKHRIEEFIISEQFTVEDMKNKLERRKLMFFVQKIHEVKPDFINKESLFDRCLNDSFPLISLFKEAREAKKDEFSEEELAKLKEIEVLLSEEETAFIQANYPSSPNVLSHNDFLNGNILKKPEALVLIDYEYSTYNPRAFDLANFITESLFDYDYKEAPYFKYYPETRDSDEALRDMVKYYVLFTGASGLTVPEAYEICENQEKAQAKLVECYENQDAIDAEIDGIMKEIKICTLLSHYLWILWSIVVCKNPNIKFDYIEFAYQRFKDYQGYKAKNFPATQ